MTGILAIDYGERRIGLAYGYEEIKVAVALDYLENNEDTFNLLQKIIEDKEIQKIILGYPIALKGHKTQKTLETEAFCEKLSSHISIPILKIDERLTSVQAHKIFQNAGISSKKSRQKIDSSAACILLNQYFNTK